MPFNSRKKKQLEELEAQLNSLRAEVYKVDGQVTDRLMGIESIIDGHDATLDANAKALEAYPSADSVASVEQIQDLAQTQSAVLAQHEAALAEQHAAVDGALAEQRELITAQQATIAEQQTTIQSLRARLDELSARTAADTARVEARLGEITEQVLHQVEELSNEVDAATQLAQQAADGTSVPNGLLDEIKSAQVKLANEQVRYDLALRSELAELADRLRRNGRG